MRDLKDNASGRLAAMGRALSAQREEREWNLLIQATEAQLKRPPKQDASHERNRREDDVFNWMDAWGHRQLFADLREVEKNALYCCIQPPTAEEINGLWYLNGYIEHVQAIATTSLSDEELRQACAERAKPQKRRARGIAEPKFAAQEAMMKWMLEEGIEDVVAGMRIAEKRMAYFQQDPLQDEEVASLICLRELIERLDLLAKAWAGATARERQAL